MIPQYSQYMYSRSIKKILVSGFDESCFVAFAILQYTKFAVYNMILGAFEVTRKTVERPH